MSLVAGGGREELAELATQKGTVDLIIPRGGEGLEGGAGGGGDGAGDLRGVGQLPRVRGRLARIWSRPEAIVLNAKVQRPGVCNAAETLLIHEDDRRQSSCRASCKRSATQEWRCAADERTRALAAGRERGSEMVERPAGLPTAQGASRRKDQAATEEDWGTEYLALTLAVKVVDSTEEAIEHIGRYGSGHSEAIVTRDTELRAGIPARRGRGLRVCERLDEVHRRGRVRDGGGDRQLDAEAARARADRAAGAVHVQVPGRRRRTRPRLRSRPRGGPSVGRHPRRDVQPAPPRAPRTGPAREGRAGLGSGAADAGVQRAAQGSRGGPRPASSAWRCAGWRWGTRRAAGVRAGDRARRAVLYGGYLESDP